MTINIVEICRLKYPGQIEAGNINFRKPDSEILIGEWNVAGIPKPLESDLLTEAALYDSQYQINTLKIRAAVIIADKLDSVAKTKDYNNAISCASYANSTNLTWKNEALAFIAWRDSVFAYAIDIENQVIANTIPVPTDAEFIAGIPAITWP